MFKISTLNKLYFSLICKACCTGQYTMRESEIGCEQGQARYDFFEIVQFHS